MVQQITLLYYCIFSAHTQCCNNIEVAEKQSSLVNVANTSKCKKKCDAKNFLLGWVLLTTKPMYRHGRNMRRPCNAQLYHRWSLTIQICETHKQMVMLIRPRVCRHMSHVIAIQCIWRKRHTIKACCQLRNSLHKTVITIILMSSCKW